MHVKARRARIAVALLCVGTLAAGCGSSPTDAAKGSGAANGSVASLNAVYAALNGLTGNARYQKLLELAKAEGGTVTFYHSGDMTADNKAFTAKTGLKVDDFQATSERVAERVSQENKAGHAGSDVVIGAATDMVALQAQGGIAKLDTPATDSVAKDFKSVDLVSPIVIMETASYNTNTVKRSELPKSWEDYFSTFSKRKAIELTDWEWYWGVVTKYFVAQKHMTEDQAIELITTGMKGASAVDGHSLAANLLASGQYDSVPNIFSEEYAPLVKKGAPVSYMGINSDLPPTAVIEFMGLTAGAKHPASGLLYTEWLLSTDGQSVVASTDYVPTADTYRGAPTLLQQFPYALIDDAYGLPQATQDKWKTSFDALLQAAGTKKIAKKKK
jgi:iron(III) transport system substrate-binding protein